MPLDSYGLGGNGRREEHTENDVGILGFLLDNVDRVQISDHHSHVGVLAGELGGLVLGPDQDGRLPVGMGLGDVVEDVAADIAGSTGAEARRWMLGSRIYPDLYHQQHH